jgi:hypothetical protein
VRPPLEDRLTAGGLHPLFLSRFAVLSSPNLSLSAGLSAALHVGVYDGADKIAELQSMRDRAGRVNAADHPTEFRGVRGLGEAQVGLGDHADQWAGGIERVGGAGGIEHVFPTLIGCTLNGVAQVSDRWRLQQWRQPAQRVAVIGCRTTVGANCRRGVCHAIKRAAHHVSEAVLRRAAVAKGVGGRSERHVVGAEDGGERRRGGAAEGGMADDVIGMRPKRDQRLPSRIESSKITVPRRTELDGGDGPPCHVPVFDGPGGDAHVVQRETYRGRRPRGLQQGKGPFRWPLSRGGSWRLASTLRTDLHAGTLRVTRWLWYQRNSSK